MASNENVPEALETDNTNIGSDDKSVYEQTLKNGIKIDENSKKIDQIITILSYIAPWNWKDKSRTNKKIGDFYSEAKKRIGMDHKSLYPEGPGPILGGRKSRKKRKTKRKRKGRKRKSRRRR